MRAITLYRVVTGLALAVVVACTTPFSPPPNSPSLEGVGMSVIPSNAIIKAGEVVALKAHLRDEFGDPIEGVTIKWSSSDDAVATVASNGEVLGQGVGRAAITANAQGKSQISGIQVLPRAPKPE
jgi:uncharacterized protein YjdB